MYGIPFTKLQTVQHIFWQKLAALLALVCFVVNIDLPHYNLIYALFLKKYMQQIFILIQQKSLLRQKKVIAAYVRYRVRVRARAHIHARCTTCGAPARMYTRTIETQN